MRRRIKKQMYSVYVVTWISVDRINLLLAFPFLLPSQKIFSCNCYYLASSLAGVNKTQSKGLFSQMKATLFSLLKVQNCNAFFANFCLNLFHKCYHLKVSSLFLEMNFRRDFTFALKPPIFFCPLSITPDWTGASSPSPPFQVPWPPSDFKPQKNQWFFSWISKKTTLSVLKIKIFPISNLTVLSPCLN